MLNNLDDLFLNLKKHFKDYFQLFQSLNAIGLIRVILCIPTVIIIIASDLSVFLLGSVKKMLLLPLIEGKKTLVDSYTSADESITSWKLENYLKNYFFGIFEVIILIAIYGINVSLYVIKGIFNLLYLLFSLNNSRLYTNL